MMFSLLQVRTIKVTNVPLSATAENMKEFFSFSGDIEYVEMRRDSETSQVAYVTFKEFHGADTALLLSVCTPSGSPTSISEHFLLTFSKSFLVDLLIPKMKS